MADTSLFVSGSAGGVALLALVKSFWRDKSADADARIRELIELTVGTKITLMQADLRRIMRKLDINGED